jgi:hypothetical protein
MSETLSSGVEIRNRSEGGDYADLEVSSGTITLMCGREGSADSNSLFCIYVSLSGSVEMRDVK